MLSPTRLYDYLVLARARILDWVRPLTPEQYARTFPIGLGSLARTLTHTMSSEWYYIERLEGRDVAPWPQWPIRDDKPPPFPALEAEWTAQTARTRAAIAAPRDWAAPIEYRLMNDDHRPEIITATPADIVSQLCLHEVHHRAQAMNMLRHLGIAAEDIDYNTTMYHRRPAPQ